MSFDGNAEADAVVAKLKVLAGGRVSEGMLDEALVPREPSGKVKPYICCIFSTPVATASGRGLGGETTQPYVLSMVITAYAGDAGTARRLATDGILKQLLGWQPNGANSTPLKSPGGYSKSGKSDTSNKPTRFEQGVYFTTTINQSTGV